MDKYFNLVDTDSNDQTFILAEYSNYLISVENAVPGAGNGGSGGSTTLPSNTLITRELTVTLTANTPQNVSSPDISNIVGYFLWESNGNSADATVVRANDNSFLTITSAINVTDLKVALIGATP